jgi:hypothetical protein
MKLVCLRCSQKAALSFSKTILDSFFSFLPPRYEYRELEAAFSSRRRELISIRVGRTSKEDRRKLRPLPRSADTSGLTAWHGVIVRLDCRRNLRLLAHEFVHVAQYERLGREGFLQEYIQQIAAHGYPDAPFELEAEAKAIKACRDAGVHPF